jgi:hypothetical protein
MQTSLNTPAVCGPIAGPGAWTRDTLKKEDWLLKIPPECITELARALREVQDDSLPVHEIDTVKLHLPACVEFMMDVRRVLETGTLFAVVDRLPFEEWSKAEMTRAYWMLASLLSRPVQQTFAGTMLFDVRDLGLAKQMLPGSGIRSTVTNLDLNFHNDNCFNTLIPTFIGLLCLRTAKSGGISKAISFQTVHNLMREQHPEALERLYQPVWWDRHREFAPGASPVVANPVFESRDGIPLARFSIYNITGGYKILNEELDAELRDALKAMLSFIEQPQLQCQMSFEPGQIQFLNNRAIGHARTDFIDHPEPDQKRHLVRLWMRDSGQVGYEG